MIGIKGGTHGRQLVRVLLAGLLLLGTIHPTRAAVDVVPPSDLAVVFGDGQFTLTWSPSPDADKYKLYPEPDTAGAGVVAYHQVSAPATTWTRVATSGATYGYRISVVTTAGVESGKSDVLLFKYADAVGPLMPSGVYLEPMLGQVWVYWMQEGHQDGDVYWLSHSADNGATWLYTLVDSPLTETIDGTPYFRWPVTNLSSGTYLFAVERQDVAGELSPAVILEGAPLDPLVAPTNLTAVPGEAAIDLTWDDSNGAAAERFFVYRDGVLVGTPTVPAFRDRNLTPGQAYGYTVHARSDSRPETSPASEPTSGVPAEAIPPGLPTELRAEAYGASGLLFTWTAPADADLAGYRLSRDGVLLTSVLDRTVYFVGALPLGSSVTLGVRSVDTYGHESLPVVLEAATQPLVGTGSGSTTVGLPGSVRTVQETPEGAVVRIRARGYASGFPVVAAPPTEVHGLVGSLPAGYTVEVLDDVGGLIGSTVVQVDGSWQIATSQAFADLALLQIRYRP